MEYRTSVTYKGRRAHYSVIPDKGGIYHAHLLSYEGGDGEAPPENILLVKGATRWTGSHEPYFMQQLGQVIETRKRSGDPSTG